MSNLYEAKYLFGPTPTADGVGLDIHPSGASFIAAWSISFSLHPSLAPGREGYF